MKGNLLIKIGMIALRRQIASHHHHQSSITNIIITITIIVCGMAQCLTIDVVSDSVHKAGPLC